MLPNQYLKKTAAIALALGAITPAAAIAKELGTNGFGETSPKQTPTVHVTRHVHHRPIPDCGAVLDPMTGQMHGGCPPDHPIIDAATR